MTSYLFPCRKCHSGLRLWDRQHAEQKCVYPRPLSNDKDGGGLVDRHLRTSLCHHPKGNKSAFLVSLLGILQMLNLYAKCNAVIFYCLFVNQIGFLNQGSIISHIGCLIVWNCVKGFCSCCGTNISIHFQQFPASSLHKFVKMDLLQEEQQNTPPLCFDEKRILCRGKIMKLHTLQHSHSHHTQSLCLLKQLAHQNTLYDKTVYATPKMMTFGWNIIFLSDTMK